MPCACLVTLTQANFAQGSHSPRPPLKHHPAQIPMTSLKFNHPIVSTASQNPNRDSQASAGLGAKASSSLHPAWLFLRRGQEGLPRRRLDRKKPLPRSGAFNQHVRGMQPKMSPNGLLLEIKLIVAMKRLSASLDSQRYSLFTPQCALGA